MKHLIRGAALAPLVALAACGGVLQTHETAPVVYALSAPAPARAAAARWLTPTTSCTPSSASSAG